MEQQVEMSFERFSELLNSPDPRVGVATLTTLRKNGQPNLGQLIFEYGLSNMYDDCMAVALQILAELRYPLEGCSETDRDLFTTVIVTSNEGIILAAVRWLIALCSSDSLYILRWLIPFLEDYEKVTLELAIWLVGNDSAVREGMIKALISVSCGDLSTTEVLVGWLAGLDPKSAMADKFVELMLHQLKFTEDQLLRMVDILVGTGQTDLLYDTVTSEDEFGDGPRLAALRALSTTDTDSSRRLVESLLDDQDTPRFRLLAFEVLFEREPFESEALAGLIRRAMSDDEELTPEIGGIRQLGYRQLNRLPERHRTDLLLKVIGDESLVWYVRNDALNELLRINRDPALILALLGIYIETLDSDVASELNEAIFRRRSVRFGDKSLTVSEILRDLFRSNRRDGLPDQEVGHDSDLFDPAIEPESAPESTSPDSDDSE